MKSRTCFKCELPTAGYEWTVIITAQHNVTKKTKILKLLCGNCAGIKNEKAV